MSTSFASLNGLRGLASLHIALHHLSASCLHIEIRGPVELPLFFLLSGFSLAQAYDKPGLMDNKWNVLEFYKNRISRMIPTYYLITLGVLIMAQIDLFELAVNSTGTLLMNMFCMVTWTYPLCNFYNIGCFGLYMGVSWTVHTLFFCYICFPFVINIFQRLSNTGVYNLLVICFYIQMVPWLYIGHIYNWQRSGQPYSVFWTIVASPLSRFPLFCMGVLAGILQTRHQQPSQQAEAPQQKLETDNFFLFDLIPIPKVPGLCYFGLFEKLIETCSCKGEMSRRWQLKVDGYSVLLLSLFFIPGLFLTNQGQLVVCYIQLMVVISLCNDGGHSFLAKLCATRPIQMLGDVSMTLYLFHGYSQAIMKNYLGLRLNGIYELMFATTLSIAVSWIITVFYEVPIKSLCRGQSLQTVGKQLVIKNRWAVPKLILICLTITSISFIKI